MPEQDSSARWIAAMQAGDTEAKKKIAEGTSSDADGDVLGNAASRAARAAGKLSKVERENRKRERQAARELEAQRKPRHDKPKIDNDDKLRLKATIGHVTFDESEVWAWYVVAGVSHGFSPVEDIEHAITNDAKAYAKLVDRRLRIRSTTRPYSVRQWAKDTYDDARASGKPVDAFGNMYLPNSQRHMQQRSFSEKWVMLGVRISTFRKFGRDPLRELAALRGTIDDISNALGNSSLLATPASTEDMEWLLRRSVALGIPMPRIGVSADYEREDIAELTASAEWTAEPLTQHLTVSATVPDSTDRVKMEVAVLALGRLSDQAIPQETQTGWMQRTDRLGFPVEWVATIDVIPEQKTQGWIRGRMDIIRDQMKHYVDEHQIAPPASLNRHMAIATDVQSQLDSDHGGTAIRTVGWYRVAISAPDEKTLKDRIAKLRAVYGSRAELIEVPNQYHTAREFIPNEPIATGAHRRRMSVTTLAAAIPQGTAEVGDRCGVTLGYTAGSAMRAVAWNTHWDMELRDRSGLLLVAGGLGSGKTNTMGWIIVQSVLSGVQWSVFDPSDRLGRLCDLDELKDPKTGKSVARYINLMKGRAGELGPYRVVADPRIEHYETKEEWEREVSDAEGTRLSLMQDILYSFLKNELRNDDTATVITRALSEVPPLRSSSPTQVLDALDKIASGEIHEDLESSQRVRARDLSIEYRRLAQTPTGKLIFPPAGSPPLDDTDEDDKLLNVYTLNGMAIPSAQNIATGNIDERSRLSMSIMTLAAWLVQSRIYLGNPHRRKGLGIDEGKTITTIDAGKNLITKTATDSRKFNLRVILCSQNVTHFDVDSDSEDSLSNLVGAALIGHTEGDNEARAALKVLGAPIGQGYESILKTLRPQKKRREEIKHDVDGNLSMRAGQDNQPRHFIFRDGRNTERIVIDLDSMPNVKEALNSRPKTYAEAGEPVNDAPTPTDSEEAA